LSQHRKLATEDSNVIPRPALALLSTEALRQGDAPAAPPAKGEEKISIFWRVFGGTLLSIAALVLMTVYQQIANSLHDLRGDLNHVRELQVDMVKKDDLNTRTTSIWNSLKEITNDVPSLKTRTALLESQLAAAEKERKDLCREVQALRERLATVEGRQASSSRKPAESARDELP
jgi:septal ring factor EnvC (AmiA/AmiB activator)